jgi:hypothetical protein
MARVHPTRAWPVLLACACFVDNGTPPTGDASTTVAATTTGDPAPTTSSSTTAGTTTGTTEIVASATGTSTTAVDPSNPTEGSSTATGATTTTDDPGTTTTGFADPCDPTETFTVKHDITQASLGRGVELNQDLGETTAFTQSPTGWVEWKIEVPCGGPWRVWVRYLEAPGEDTYTFAFDADAPLYFDAGCADQGIGMQWRLLNARQESEKACNANIDPYEPLLDAGKHVLRIGFATNPYIGGIVVTNDATHVPN